MFERILSLLSVILFLGPSMTLPAGEAGKPEMVIEEKVFDVGEVEEGTLIKHSFIIKNQGEGTLNLKQARKS